MKQKSRAHVALLIGMALVVIALPLLAACTREVIKEVPVEKVVEKTVEKEVVKEVPVKKGLPGEIVIASGPTTLSIYVVGVAMADLISKYTPVRAYVLPAPDVDLPVDIVGAGKGDVGMIGAYSGSIAYKGEKGTSWEKGGPRSFLRVLMFGHQSPFGLMVRGNSGINRIEDLRGKKVVTDVVGSYTISFLVKSVLRAHGLDPEKDVIPWKFDTLEAALQAVKEGRVDAAGRAIIGPAIMEFEKTVGGYVVPIDRKVLEEKVAPLLPGMWSTLLKAGTLAAPTDRWAISNPIALFASEGMSEELGYNVVKAVVEHHQEKVSATQYMAEYGLEDAVRVATPPIPYHPGAIKYYKEKGVWTDEMEKHQAQLLKELGK